MQLAALVCSGSGWALTEDGTGPAVPPLSPLFAEGRGATPAAQPSKAFFSLPAPLYVDGWRAEREEFSLHPAAPGDGVAVTKSARYRKGGTTFGAEMGELTIEESAGTVSDLTRRGGRFSLARSDGSTGVELKSFAFTGGNAGDYRSYLVGGAGSLSLFDTVQLKTVYVSAKEMLAPGRWSRNAARRGDVVGFSAAVDPYRGRLALEGELDYALFDADTTDAAPPAADVACRARLGGGAAGYRYSATFERTGPRYRIISGTHPRSDWEGYAAVFRKEVGAHALELTASRYNDNVRNNPLVATVYRYQGTVEYTLQQMEALPVGLLYAKTVEGTGSAGAVRSGSDEESWTGRLNYRGEEWGVGVRAVYLQRTDLAADQQNFAAATLGVAPTFKYGGLAVAPDLTLKRSFYLLEGQRSDEYAAGVDIGGKLLGRQLDYQVKGGYRKVVSDLPDGSSRSLVARLKLAYPLKRLFGGVPLSTLGLSGEYNGGADPARRESAYSLLVVLDGR